MPLASFYRTGFETPMTLTSPWISLTEGTGCDKIPSSVLLIASVDSDSMLLDNWRGRKTDETEPFFSFTVSGGCSMATQVFGK